MACVCDTAILQFADYELSGAGTEGQGQASVWAVTVNGNTWESLASSEPTQVPFDSVISLNMFSAFCYEHFLSVHLFSINVYILIVFSQTIIIKPSNYQTTKSPNHQTTKSYHQIIITILLIVAATIQILLSLSLSLSLWCCYVYVCTCMYISIYIDIYITTCEWVFLAEVAKARD